MGIRTAATQLGCFIGSAAAGFSLATHGYPGLGMTLGLFFVGAALALNARLPRGAQAPAANALAPCGGA